MGYNLFRSSLPLFLAFAGAAAAQADPVPTPVPEKKIVIYNDTDQKVRIYPVIEAGRNIGNADLWMQAEIGISSSETYARQFPRKLNYRAYINLPKKGDLGGILPGQSVTITVPFFTQLKKVDKNDVGKFNDQFIDWWNGGRVYFFYGHVDLNSALITYDTASGPPQKVVSLSGAALPSCTLEGGGAGCDVTLLTYTIDPLFNIPFQLQEYTFASAEGPPPGGLLKPGSPLTIDPEKVNYNVSSLDSVYLPVAMGPLDASADTPEDKTRYLGTALTLSAFNSTLKRFSSVGGWPFYVPAYFDKDIAKHPGFPPIYGAACSLAPFPGMKPYLTPKLPGAANLLIASYTGIPSSSDDQIVNPPIPPTLSSQPADYKTFPGYAVNQCVSMGIDPYNTPALGNVAQGMVDLWRRCTKSTVDTSATCTDIRTVSHFFKANYKATCGRNSEPDEVSVLFAVYGWVPIRFPLYTQPNCQGGPLSGGGKTPTPEYVTANEAYCRLQYNYLTVRNSADVFNPYTQLVHQTLKSSAYAFSIDDKASFRSVRAKGVTFAIGGTSGLQNTTPSPLPTKDTILDYCKTP